MATCLLVVGSMVGCGGKDCEDACGAMRDCGQLRGTAMATCEVTCAEGEGDREDAIDECATCFEDDCAPGCVQSCVCTLQLDRSAYPGVTCPP